VCVCVCAQPDPTAGGEEETTKSVRNVSPLSLSLPPSIYPSHLHQNPSSLSCHPPAWLCNAHSSHGDELVLGTYRNTAAAVGRCRAIATAWRSACLRLSRPLHGILQLSPLFRNISRQTRLIQGRARSYLGSGGWASPRPRRLSLQT